MSPTLIWGHDGQTLMGEPPRWTWRRLKWRIRRALGLMVNARDFGVDPRVHDNTAALQRAMDTGKDVWIPAGTYKMQGKKAIVDG